MKPRAGFVWVAGRWEWRGKWEWVAGHWERERAGKQWRDGRWDKRDGGWVYVDGSWIDAGGGPPPPPIAGRPTTAPPPPRNEKLETRAGFVWIPGQWDWRNDKWEWVAGHWERERAGKQWRPSRWEQRDGAWSRIDGDWIDAVVATLPVRPAPPRHQPRKLDRPVVSGYWPAKGKAGTRIVIRGKNFPSTAEVLFAQQPVRAAKVTATEIVFAVPAGAASGAISVRDGRRELAVGMFEVAAAYDPIAEQRRLEEERRKQAEAAWAARQAQLAKDRAAREAAMRKAMQERIDTRERRRAELVAALQAKFRRDFLADPDTQDELTLHAQRVAELTRARDVAEVLNDGKLVVRIDIAQAREDQRHQERMAALEASFKARGGTR